MKWLSLSLNGPGMARPHRRRERRQRSKSPHARPLRLAPHNLRIETAAIAGAAAYHQALPEAGEHDDVR